MANHSYLSKYLQNRNKILLYGRGKNGQTIFDFLKKQPSICIVGWIDRNADMMTEQGIPIFRPDQLKSIPPESYDGILVTVLEQKPGTEIYQSIRECGISEDKIITPYTYHGPVTSLEADDFIQSPQLVQQEITNFIDHQYGNLAYFEPLIQSLKRKSNEKGDLFKNTVYLLSPLENVVFLYILYLSNNFDSECMEHLLQNALKINLPKLRKFLHGVFNDTTLMCFNHANYLFPDFFNLRRRFLEKLCKMYELRIEGNFIRKRSDFRIKKICIFSMVLLDEKSSPTLITMQMSRHLVEAGYEVMIIPLDPLSYTALNTPVFSPVCWSTYDGAKDFKDYHKRVCHPDVTVVYTDIIDAKDRMQYQLDKLAEFSPDLIIDTTDEFSIPSYIYSKYFLTLYFPMRGYQSSSFFTYFVARDQAGFLHENSVYHSIDQKNIVEFPVCILPPEPRNSYRREMFFLEESDFVLITVGIRLNTEMSKEFIDSICKNLLCQPNIKWLIVGSKNDYISQKYDNCLNARKIIYISYEEDLPALYKLCNLYINPNRMGGGASLTWAMHYGLPIATLSSSNDVMKIIGNENMIASYDAMVDYAFHLKNDLTYWKKESKKFKDRAFLYEKDQFQLLQSIIEKIEEKRM